MAYIVVGTGGHSKVVIDILKASNEKIIGMVDDFIQENHLFGIPILGTIDKIEEIIMKIPDAYFIVAIGDNQSRKMVVKQLNNHSINFGTAIHPSAIIGSNVLINKGTVIMPNTVINAGAIIGEHVILNTACTVDHDCHIESYSHLSPGVHLAGNVTVGEGVHLGIGTNIIQGIAVGTYSVIGAGSCVIDNVPANVVAVGCPAKVIKTSVDKG